MNGILCVWVGKLTGQSRKACRMGDADPSQECPFCGRLSRRRDSRQSLPRHHEAGGRIHRRDRIVHLDVEPPHLHRNHPYWMGAIVAHRLRCSRKLARQVSCRPQMLVASDGLQWWTSFIASATLFSAVRLTFEPWHPRWPDYRDVHGSRATSFLSGTQGRLLDYFQARRPRLVNLTSRSRNRSCRSI